MKPSGKQPSKRTPGSRVTCQTKARPKPTEAEQVAKLRRELRAAKKRAAIAEVDRAADAQIVKNVEMELANLVGLVPPIGILTELKRLCSEVLATRETIKLATNRMGEALGDTAGPPTTTGRMLNMIVRLIEARNFHRERNVAMIKLLNELTTDRDAANDLIARLAFNLTRGPDQERIENASPAEHRAIVEAEALKLVELSLKLEMAEPRLAAPEDANNRVLAAEMRWEVELVRLTPRTNETLTDDDLRALFAAHCECRPLDLSRADDDHSHDCDTAILRDAQRAMGFVGTPEQHLAGIRAGDDAEKARIRCVEHWNRDVDSEIYAPRLASALTNL